MFRQEGEAAIKRAKAAQERIEVMRQSQVSLCNEILAEFQCEGMVPSPERKNPAHGETRVNQTIESTQGGQNTRMRLNVDLPRHSESRTSSVFNDPQNHEMMNKAFRRSINRDITTNKYQQFRNSDDDLPHQSDSDRVIQSARRELEQPRHDNESESAYRQ